VANATLNGRSAREIRETLEAAEGEWIGYRDVEGQINKKFRRPRELRDINYSTVAELLERMYQTERLDAIASKRVPMIDQRIVGHTVQYRYTKQIEKIELRQPRTADLALFNSMKILILEYAGSRGYGQVVTSSKLYLCDELLAVYDLMTLMTLLFDDKIDPRQLVSRWTETKDHTPADIQAKKLEYARAGKVTDLEITHEALQKAFLEKLRAATKAQEDIWRRVNQTS